MYGLFTILGSTGTTMTPRRKRTATFETETWEDLKEVRRALSAQQNHDVPLWEVLDRALRRGLAEIRRDMEKAGD